MIRISFLFTKTCDHVNILSGFSLKERSLNLKNFMMNSNLYIHRSFSFLSCPVHKPIHPLSHHALMQGGQADPNNKQSTGIFLLHTKQVPNLIPRHESLKLGSETCRDELGNGCFSNFCHIRPWMQMRGSHL